MVDLIDRQAMLARLEEWNTSDSTDKALYNFTLNRILEQPTIESQRKKGRWIDTESSYADGVRQECRCSVCSRLSPRPLGDFCRWCGADMRGEEDG